MHNSILLLSIALSAITMYTVYMVHKLKNDESFAKKWQARIDVALAAVAIFAVSASAICITVLYIAGVLILVGLGIVAVFGPILWVIHHLFQ